MQKFGIMVFPSCKTKQILGFSYVYIYFVPRHEMSSVLRSVGTKLAKLEHII